MANIRQLGSAALEVTVTGPAPDDEEAGRPREERRYRVPADAKLRIQDGEIVEANEALTVDDLRIAAQRINIPPEGWRVDQILMLPYFGLERTRDAKTAELLEKFTRLTAMPNPNSAELQKVADELRILSAGSPRVRSRAQGV